MTSPAPTPTRRSPALAILVVAMIAMVAWGAKRVSYNRTHESTDNAQIDGTILPIVAKVGGYVTEVSARENLPVKAGTMLVRIDSAEYQAKLAQADADLAAAAAIAGGLGGAGGQAGAQIAGAMTQQEVLRTQQQAASTARAKAAADYQRLRDLAAKQIVSAQQLENAKAALDQAEASEAAITRQISYAGTQVENAKAGERLAQARLAAARAARANAALQLQWTHVAAPLNGTVSRKQVEVGQLVQAGQPLLTLVASDSAVWITANFKETQLGNLKEGQKAVIPVDTYPGCEAEGTVQSVSAATGARFALLPPDNSTGNFTKVVQRVPVRILISKDCGADKPLRPGMSVTVHVATN